MREKLREKKRDIKREIKRVIIRRRRSYALEGLLFSGIMQRI